MEGERWKPRECQPRVEAEVPEEEVVQGPAGGRRELEHSEEVWERKERKSWEAAVARVQLQPLT